MIRRIRGWLLYLWLDRLILLGALADLVVLLAALAVLVWVGWLWVGVRS